MSSRESHQEGMFFQLSLCRGPQEIMKFGSRWWGRHRLQPTRQKRTSIRPAPPPAPLKKPLHGDADDPRIPPRPHVIQPHRKNPETSRARRISFLPRIFILFFGFASSDSQPSLSQPSPSPAPGGRVKATWVLVISVSFLQYLISCNRPHHLSAQRVMGDCRNGVFPDRSNSSTDS